MVSYVDDLTVGGRRNSKGCYEDQATSAFPTFGDKKPDKVPQDCFPQRCYERCPCWGRMMETRAGSCWTGLRISVLSVVDTPAFEWFVLVLIFASSITLCFEDIHLDANKPLKRILYWTNLGFCLIFIIEMVLKWIALGFTKYFSSFWTILDFVIVFVSQTTLCQTTKPPPLPVYINNHRMIIIISSSNDCPFGCKLMTIDRSIRRIRIQFIQLFMPLIYCESAPLILIIISLSNAFNECSCLSFLEFI